MIEPLESSAIELLNSDELLDDDAWLNAALRRWNLAPHRPLRPSDTEAFRQLRDRLRILADAVAAYGRLPPAELALLNELLSATPLRAQLVAPPVGGYVLDLQPLATEWSDYAIGQLAGAFGSMLRRSHPPRLKLCEGCRTAFWDATRSRTRRWCNTSTCGNRARVRRHRARPPQ
jgi:predicted RNA-binding Zn ribbon-like protein